MKKFLLGSIAAAAFIASPAMAADMAVKAPVYKAPPPPPVALFTWTGCYIGGHGGGLWVRKDYTLPVTTLATTQGFPFTATAGTGLGSHDANSGLGGGQVGCNYQIDRVVFGIRGDIAGTSAKGSHVSPLGATFTDSSSTKSLSTATASVGLALDRLLLYVRGGGAWERDSYDFRNITNTFISTASETRGGWTVGVGGEYAFLDFLSVFAEYDYFDFGTRTDAFLITTGLGGSYPISIRERKSVFKVGLNLRWGPATVVAKY
jgi:outer membrane immunogenic protein